MSLPTSLLSKAIHCFSHHTDTTRGPLYSIMYVNPFSSKKIVVQIENKKIQNGNAIFSTNMKYTRKISHKVSQRGRSDSLTSWYMWWKGDRSCDTYLCMYRYPISHAYSYFVINSVSFDHYIHQVLFSLLWL